MLLPTMHQLAPILSGDRVSPPCSILVRISLNPVTFVCNAAALVAKARRWNEVLHGGTPGLPCNFLVRISLNPVAFVCNAAAQVAKAGDGIG